MTPGELPLRPFGRAYVPAATGSDTAEFDRWAIDTVGVPQAALMENAGRCAARVVHRLHPSGEIVGFVGSGNNGGDALVALRSLAGWGREVRAVLAADRRADDPLFHGWPVRVESGPDADVTGAAVLLDGILGTGIHGAPRERQARAIASVNGSGRPVVALDVPSGVDADTGAVPGEAVRAGATVAFGWPKLGTLLHPGRAWVGRLVAVDIGFPPVPAGRFHARVITPAMARELRPRRRPDTHKKAVGVLVVLAGGPGMAGAALLAARAAMRAGAGLVRVASHDGNRAALQSALPDGVFVDAGDSAALKAALGDATALVAGPGLGTSAWAEDVLREALTGPALPTLLDADALNLVSEGRSLGLAELSGARALLVTPHPGEFRRLTGAPPDVGASGLIDAARELAAAARCVVLLKGSPSVVARPGGELLVDSVGTSDLAVAGAGDVLAGAAGAFLAAGVEPASAAALALHACGTAALRARRGAGLMAGDLPDHLPAVLAEEGPGETDLDLPEVVFDQEPSR